MNHKIENKNIINKIKKKNKEKKSVNNTINK